ncbi:AAA ATPase [Desulfonatronospira thiodismutans ASO3-1]|uniref:AAA ATPase n=1 Tax=Desulfonatronospira thiodismutans ASO3-1 TaxID=555779 RepID=D6SPM9_9BACT|nr:AAA family ATPase [Desulfonatronospira thiodismutans]EFI34705.1 AAA ATPase [Desulfonatronospira thiodismutans ASO3-1]
MNYQKFFGFKEAPFHQSPDPAYYFSSETHREALQLLVYSIRAGEGFVQVTGDPGTGKTMLIRTILRELGEDMCVALVFNPRLSPQDLLRALLEDLGHDPAMLEELTRETMLRRLKAFLLEQASQDKRVLVIIDEAQNLPLDTLEELRLLSNLERDKEKLLQIMLVGQRELEQRLDQPEVRNLHQRITIRYRIRRLGRQEVQAYIHHRLRIAAMDQRAVQVQFDARALRAIYRFSRGIPRVVNILCERSLMSAYVVGRKTIYVGDVKKAMTSISGRQDEYGIKFFLRSRKPSAALVTALLLVVLFAGWLHRPEIVQTLSSLWAEQETQVEKTREPAPAGADDPEINLAALHRDTSAFWKSLETDKAAKDESDTLQNPPQEVFSASPGSSYVRVLTDVGHLQVWKKDQEGHTLSYSMEIDWPYGQGIFLMGKDPDQGEYLYNYSGIMGESPFRKKSPFFKHVDHLVPGNAVPVLAVQSEYNINDLHLDKAGEVKPVFEEFLSVWQDMSADDMFEHYAGVITRHYLDQPEPDVVFREEAHLRQQNIFHRSGFIELEVNRPVFMLDPLDPETVMVIYHQEYRSAILQDVGTKVFFFARQEDAAKEHPWKIKAEMWVKGS